MTMTRYKFHVSYDGSRFSGFQVQTHERTVQGEIEKALQQISKGRFIRIHGAGRTDAGVHAKGQVLHFDFPNALPPESMQRALNTLVPKDIVLFNPEIVTADFHSQYSALHKTYEFHVYNHELRNPFLWNYSIQHPYPMNLEAVEKALSLLVGTHDFTSFSSAKTDKVNKVRTLYEASVKVDEQTNMWVFTFCGDGFLYHMIRIIIGTLLPIADGRRNPEEITEMLAAKDRQSAGMTAYSNGLCLMEVSYEPYEKKDTIKKKDFFKKH